MQAQELTAKFAIPGVLGFSETPTGLVKAVVSCAAGAGELFLQGAQLTGWTPAGERPVLFTSSRSDFAPGKAIRGGIPVIFPWFGPYRGESAAPQHGFARAVPWRLEAVARGGDGEVGLTLSFDHPGGAPPWPQPARLEYHVEFGKALSLALTVINPSPDPMSFEAALHSYFAVSDVTAVTVTGLENRPFIDKVDGATRKREGAAPLALRGETDRVYLGTPPICVIADPLWQRRLVIEKSGADSTIVWNPWREKAAAMADLGDAEWQEMICVESGNVADNSVRLDAGARHRMTTRIAVDADAQRG